jgi:hypothetical protein
MFSRFFFPHVLQLQVKALANGFKKADQGQLKLGKCIGQRKERK